MAIYLTDRGGVGVRRLSSSGEIFVPIRFLRAPEVIELVWHVGTKLPSMEETLRGPTPDIDESGLAGCRRGTGCAA